MFALEPTQACVCTHVCAPAPVWRCKDNFWVLALPFHHVCSRDETVWPSWLQAPAEPYCQLPVSMTLDLTPEPTELPGSHPAHTFKDTAGGWRAHQDVLVPRGSLLLSPGLPISVRA